MEHLDEGTIHAWLDGALPPDESARLQAHVASCTECSTAVAEARGLIAASTRILAALDDVPAVQQGGGEAAMRDRPTARTGAGAARAQKRAPWFRTRYAAAAGIAAIAISSMIVARDRGAIMQSPSGADATAVAAEQGSPESGRVSAPSEAAAKVAGAAGPESPRPPAAPSVPPSTANVPAPERRSAESRPSADLAASAERKLAAATDTPIAAPSPSVAPAPARALSDSAPRELARALRAEATAQKSEVRDLVPRVDSASRRGDQPQRLSPAIRPDELARNERARIAGEPKVMNAEVAGDAAKTTEPLVASIVGCWRFDTGRRETGGSRFAEFELTTRPESPLDSARYVAVPLGEAALRESGARDWGWWIDRANRTISIARRHADVMDHIVIAIDWLVPRESTRAARVPCRMR